MYLCSHEMVTVTTKFTIATGDLRTAGRRSRKAKTRMMSNQSQNGEAGEGLKEKRQIIQASITHHCRSKSVRLFMSISQIL